MGLKGLKVTIAETKEDKDTVNNIVTTHHSYLAKARVVGRVIKYMIWYESELVGTFWLGSGFKPTPKDILNYLGKSQKEYDKIFNTVADNKRFTLSRSVKNLGSASLRVIRMRAKEDWKLKYGDNLTAIITTIGGGKSGSVYLADNWIKIGTTAGLPPNRKSVSMKWNSKEEIKERYVKPTGKDKKVILITQKL